MNPYNNQTYWVSDFPVENMQCFGIWTDKVLLVIDNYQKNIPSKIIALDAGTGRIIFQQDEERQISNAILTYYGVVYETISENTETSINVFSEAGGFCWWRKSSINNRFIITGYYPSLVTDITKDSFLIKRINNQTGKFEKCELRLKGLYGNGEIILFDYPIIYIDKSKNTITSYY